MRSDRIEYTVYVIQGWFPAGRVSEGYWSDLASHAVAGCRRWRDHPHRVRYLGEKFYSDCLAFDDVETAREALRAGRRDPLHENPYGRHLGDLIKRYKLRLVERRVLMEQVEVELEPRRQKMVA